VSDRAPSATREVFGGAFRVFAAEALVLPTALVTAGYLTRHLGPSGYGVLTLATAIVVWLEWTLSALFSRAAVKLIADAGDWRPAGAVVLRLFGLSGLLGLLGLWVVATPIATLMHEPSLAHYLRVLALDVPLFTLAQAHQQVLVGTGQYTRRATVAAWRVTARMVLVVSLVAAGYSIDGAIVGIVAASFVEVVVARYFVQPAIRGATAADARVLWAYALPLFVAAMSTRLFDKLDLFALKALGSTAALAGIYGAAQNLTIIPGLVALSVTPLLLSTLTRSLRAGDEAGARSLVRNALRGTLLLIPFAGAAAGLASGIATLIFGAEFAGTGPLLAILIFGAVAVVIMSVTAALLIAAGRAGWTLVAALPLAPAALAGHLIVIPRFGATGAAAVTTTVALGGAFVALAVVRRAWGIIPPGATVIRALASCGLALALGSWWNPRGAMVIVALAAFSLLLIGMLWALGEFTPAERAQAAAMSGLRF
jgi:O-antigen/teichoic acid export membrane protein